MMFPPLQCGLACWTLVNLAMTHHMLQEPLKNYLRLTVLSQHTVTIFSLLFCWQSIRCLEQHEGNAACRLLDGFLKALHLYLTTILAKVAILFTGLLLIMVLHELGGKLTAQQTATSETTLASQENEGKSPLSRKPTTLARVLRNVYAHYGSLAVFLWISAPTAEGNPSSLQFTPTVLLHVDLMLIMWVVMAEWAFGLPTIYDIKQLQSTQLIVPLALLSATSNGLLWITFGHR